MTDKPAPFIICPVCKGEEKVDTMGVVKPGDFDEITWERYLAGEYDSTCTYCHGKGKVRDEPERQAPIYRTGSDGQNVVYDDADDASEHWLRMAEGYC